MNLKPTPNWTVMSLVLLGAAFCAMSCFTPKPANPYAVQRLNICLANIHNQEYASAKLNCELCLQFDKSTPECLNGMGIVAMSQGQSEEAVTWFTKAVHENSNFAQARSNLGTIHLGRSEYSKSLPFFKAAIATDPGFIDARYNYSLAYLHLGYQNMQSNVVQAEQYFDDAIKEYRLLIELDTQYINAYRDLGLIMTYKGELGRSKAEQMRWLDNATMYFSQCLQLNAEHEACLESYAHTVLVQGQYQRAVNLYMRCLAVNKNNPSCIADLQRAQSGLNLEGNALNRFKEALAKEPANALLHYSYCQALFDHGMDNEASAECRQAATLDRNLCSAHHTLGMYYKRLFNAPGAALNCRAYLECDNPHKLKAHIDECKEVLVAVQ